MTIDVESAAATEFVGKDKAWLRDAMATMGLAVGPNTSEANMRAKLLEALGKVLPTEIEAPKPVKRTSKSIFDPKPNLTSSGKWGGRRHDVLLQKGMEAQNSKSEYAPLRWEESLVYAKYGTVQPLPEPHFHALNNARGYKVGNEDVTYPDGRKEVLHPLTPFQTITFNYIGVTKGTEHLPASKQEYWQRQAEKTNNFRPDGKLLNRQILIQIRSDLYDPVGRDFFKEYTDEDIWSDIMIFLVGEEAYDELLQAA